MKSPGNNLAGSIAIPGKDNMFGKKYFRNIDEAKSNDLGLIWDDKAAQDDIVTNRSICMLSKVNL